MRWHWLTCSSCNTSSTPGANDYSQRSPPGLCSPVENEPLHERAFNQGYYERFFVEEKRLGRGLRGQVFLCQASSSHILDQVQLGEYAVKKVPVGDNQAWLLRMLREVHLLEKLHHPNIVDYKHAWLEQHQATTFGPRVPCLFILMECANGGNLEEYLTVNDAEPTSSRQQRRHSQPNPLANTMVTLRLLPLDEVEHFMLGVCQGLAHLHRNGIIHRDLKPSNLLLSYDDQNSSNGLGIPAEFGVSKERDGRRLYVRSATRPMRRVYSSSPLAPT
ncbi:kinase-like domain-containing protein [Thamnocephalis sphaerospora]|uniref:non-specific serine/threonine protein kinase n=1 Tax=Thamnocephalis sphaerospora TaxID=78915 RepID=A0A4P9XUN3_9FUNG|nr:kinase-like domain-containing protein [Thamnocephalis sphaerospora]|eukprot:RKP09926.1 kinase-like domain-containing protein [Thamnocephalis sphaerospora]